MKKHEWTEEVRDRLSDIIFGALVEKYCDDDWIPPSGSSRKEWPYAKPGDLWVQNSNSVLKRAGWNPKWRPFKDSVLNNRFGTYRVHMDHRDEPGKVNVTLAKDKMGGVGGGGGRLWSVSIPEDEAMRVLALEWVPF